MNLQPRIIFEDSEILVLDKPAGLPVTRSQTISGKNLQDYLSNYFNLGSSLGIGSRAGIVHRLDKETSGVILVAKTLSAFKLLQQQFKDQKISKTYLVLTHQIPKTVEFSVDLPVARKKFGKFATKSFGRTATTNFKLLKKYQFGSKFDQVLENLAKNWQRYCQVHAKFYSLLQAAPKTGRTHQIRVHLKSLQLPIVADSLYTPRKLVKFDKNFCPRMFLHAAKITFFHPKSKKAVTFESDLANDLKTALLYLKEIE